MIATVISNDGSQVKIRVRRASRAETLWGQHADLNRGDRIEVKRVTNNPFPVRVVTQGAK